MKVSILERQRGMIDHAQIEHAARYFAAQLLSARMMGNLKLKIELRGRGILGKDNDGFVMVNMTSEAQTEFRICLDKSLPMKALLKALAHEIVHVAQVVMKRYQLKKGADSQAYANWEGKQLGILDKIPYATRPWEIEANSKQEVLFASYCKDHRGQIRL